jgi:acyl-CoA thioester hydrolase
MQAFETSLRVRYSETDQMGVVYHSNYLIWMEVGRIEWCRARAVNYREMEADGVLLAVVEAGCRYLAPARYDDEISIRTNIASANRRMVRFEYEIRCGRRLLATGFTRHLFLNRELRPTPLPARYQELFAIGATAS